MASTRSLIRSWSEKDAHEPEEDGAPADQRLIALATLVQRGGSHARCTPLAPKLPSLGAASLGMSTRRPHEAMSWHIIHGGRWDESDTQLAADNAGEWQQTGQ